MKRVLRYLAPGLFCVLCFACQVSAAEASTAPAKTCGEISQFVARTLAASQQAKALWSGEGLQCAAAMNVPADAALDLSRERWNAGLQRWEFTLRCVRAQQCLPFLAWGRGEAPPPNAAVGESRSSMERAALLVKKGQPAMLTWDQDGIRVALPVTCLDAGELGETVRVRLKNIPRTLRAEVVAAGAVRIGL